MPSSGLRWLENQLNRSNHTELDLTKSGGEVLVMFAVFLFICIIAIRIFMRFNLGDRILERSQVRKNRRNNANKIDLDKKLIRQIEKNKSIGQKNKNGLS